MRDVNIKNCSNPECGVVLGETLYMIKAKQDVAYCSRRCRSTITNEPTDEPAPVAPGIGNPASDPRVAPKKPPVKATVAKETPAVPKKPAAKAEGAKRGRASSAPWNDPAATLHSVKGAKIPRMNGMRGEVYKQFSEGITIKDFLAKCDKLKLKGKENIPAFVRGSKILEVRAAK